MRKSMCNRKPRQYKPQTISRIPAPPIICTPAALVPVYKAYDAAANEFKNVLVAEDVKAILELPLNITDLDIKEM